MSRRRGQALVMFSLLTLLLVVMVMLGLAVGSRVRSKMEMQTLADTAAYSNAVQTARSLNFMAMTNRAAVSQFVALSAVQGLISYTSEFRAATYVSYNHLACDIRKRYWPNGCLSSNFCQMRLCNWTGAVASSIVRQEYYRFGKYDQFDHADEDAAAQAKKIQMSIFAITKDQKKQYEEVLLKALEKQALTQQLVNQSGARDVDVAPEGDQITLFDIKGGDGCGGKGAICTKNDGNSHMVFAAQGTRGDAFLTSRKPAEEKLKEALEKFMDLVEAENQEATITQEIRNYKGSSYFAEVATKETPTHAQRIPSDGSVWGDDHMDLRTTLTLDLGGGCNGTFVSNFRPVGAFVRSDDFFETDDTHKYSQRDDSCPAANDPEYPHYDKDHDKPERLRRHTLAECEVCPSIWMWFHDFNRANFKKPDEAFGQPKNHAVLTRDLSKWELPWNRRFGFDFTKDGDPAGVDLRTSPTVKNPKQVGFATGMAYYHRHQHWQEPPNLLNPFWRATLVAMDVKPDRLPDVEKVVQAAGGDMKDWQALKSVGFEGYH